MTINNLQLTINAFWSTVKSQKLTVTRCPQRGFTVIELLLYMGILVILITVLASTFGSIIDVQLESKATSSVDQDGRFILARLAYDMQSATSIASPSAGSTATSLTIKKSSESYTYKLNASNNLQLTNNSGTDNLNGEDSSISNLTFQTIGSSSTSATVQMKFTVTSRTRKTAGSQNESRTFQTTLGLQ